MDFYQAFILAVIQGLTEFLPVSSSAHLILPSQLLGWPDQGLVFDISVHVGTLLAVLIYFRKELRLMVANLLCWLFRKDALDTDGRLLLCVLLGTVPVGLAGLLFKGFIETALRSDYVIAVTTIVFGIVLLISEIYNRRALKNPERENRTFELMNSGTGGSAASADPKESSAMAASESLKTPGYVGHITETVKDRDNVRAFVLALIIGCAQAIALIPGTSRSGITMTAGYFLRMSPENAARFSFLLSIPVIILSGLMGVKDLITGGAGTEGGAGIMMIAVGTLVSFAVALLVIKLFLKFLTRIGLLPYVIYRILLGIALFAVLGAAD
ncbi:undecaprenyl-diphosphate phosphatase [Succinimonas amylolytica]|uniref:undecaprenyl-diphosphate phosphatase n=1 Tax=Succinimonas amylolytica TaxID=83769 RepID=UPI000364A50D|nr:undecaprenyl-diphosphate phosphatase [Succinimonas amylolytica]